MLFALGYICGVVTCAFITAVLLFFRKPIERAAAPIAKAVERAAPRAKGYIFEPEDDAEVVRQQRVRENAAQGKDTPISELM